MFYQVSTEIQNGIISSNIVNFETVVSSNNSLSQIPENLFDRNNATNWCSKNEPWSFVEINFLDFRVLLTNYTVKVGSWGGVGDSPKQWVVSGFNGESWFNISTIFVSGMNVASKSTTFSAQNMNIYFSSIRITMTGGNYVSSERYHFCADEFEIFGSLIDIDSENSPINNSNNNSFNIISCATHGFPQFYYLIFFHYMTIYK